MKVADLAAGRAGDKGTALDLTVVAIDDAGFEVLHDRLTEARVASLFEGICPNRTVRHVVPGLRALKFVLPDALPGGIYGGLHAGLHWQKTAIRVVLDADLS